MADEISEMSRQELEQYARSLEVLDGDRLRLQAALPECPTHGPCVPYALAWIEKAKRSVTLDDDEVPTLSTKQAEDFADALRRVAERAD